MPDHADPDTLPSFFEQRLKLFQSSDHPRGAALTDTLPIEVRTADEQRAGPGNLDSGISGVSA
jgi:hypothetical protein